MHSSQEETESQRSVHAARQSDRLSLPYVGTGLVPQDRSVGKTQIEVRN